jgi:hypothetical protein
VFVVTRHDDLGDNSTYRGRVRHLRFWSAAAGGYAALAVAYFWPLPRDLAAGIGHDNGDPLLNAWIFWWTAARPPLTRAWWEAPAFAPMPESLALSEHLLGLWPITAPLLALGCSPLVVYNLLLIASLALCGLAACALVVHLTGSRSAGIVAGCLFALAPYRLAQLAHLQILANWWGPVALLALHRQAAAGGWRWAVVFAASWLLLVLTSGYHLLFFTIVAAGAGMWLFVRRGVWRRAVPVLVATAATAVLLVPLLRTYDRAHAFQGLTRKPAEIDEYSADVRHLGTAPRQSRWWGRDEPEAYGEIALFPGIALVAGVLLTTGISLAGRRRDQARRVDDDAPTWPARSAAALAIVPLALSAVAASAPGEHVIAGVHFSLTTPAKSLTVAWVLLVAAVALSRAGRGMLARHSPLALYALLALGTWLMTLGPRARVGGLTFMYHAPYAWLMALPGGLAMRVPPRFWLWTVLALAVVTGFGVAALRRRAPRAGLVTAALLSAVAIADGWPRRMPVADVPGPLDLPPSPAAARVLELPLGDATRDVAAMWRGRAHGHPVVNGYSGYDPSHYQVLDRALKAHDATVLPALAEPAGLVIVLDTEADDADASTAMLAAAGASPATATGRWRYATLAARPAPRPAEGRRHVPRKVVAVDGADITAATTDADPHSRWSMVTPQRQGLVVELPEPIDAAALELGLGAVAKDYPTRLRVEAQVGGAWEVIFDGPGSAAALRATLSAPTDPRMVVRLAPRRAAIFRITAAQDEPGQSWSVSSVAFLDGGGR